MNLAIAVALIIIIASLALTYRGEYQWVGHAVISVLGLFTLVGVVTTGVKLAGRLRASNAGLFRQHRKISIFFAILIVGTATYGFWMTSGKVIPEPHSWLGVSIAIIALFQMIPSLVMKRTKAIRCLHRITGYTLAILIPLQVTIGIYMVLTEKLI